MIAAPQHGFVFLAMPKCASTAIQRALRRVALVETLREPAVKHLSYRSVERWVVPLLEEGGFPRRSYEVVCLCREPFDWPAKERPQDIGEHLTKAVRDVVTEARADHEAIEIGVRRPATDPVDALGPGEVGYLIAGIKDVGDARSGETVTTASGGAADPLPGYDGLMPRSAEYPEGHFLGWTPGQVAPLVPPDTLYYLQDLQTQRRAKAAPHPFESAQSGE